MLWVTVTPAAGSHARDVLIEMVDLANRMQCGVTANINGAQALANPGDDPEQQYQAWENRDFRRSRLA